MGKSLTHRIIGAIAGVLLGLALCIGFAVAEDGSGFIPKGARLYAPELVKVGTRVWPNAPEPWTFAGQVEQESCISLKHSRCWNPRAELKTSREYGFGFGQITTAYRADGSERFNKFEELKKEYGSLKTWAWADRYRADFQLQALVEMDKTLFTTFKDAVGVRDQWGFALSAYNGGKGGVLQDRVLCANTRGCNNLAWFGHVEHTSLKTRKVNPGYGKSAFEINREYPRLILDTRREKYLPFWPTLKDQLK